MTEDEAKETVARRLLGWRDADEGDGLVPPTRYPSEPRPLPDFDAPDAQLAAVAAFMELAEVEDPLRWTASGLVYPEIVSSRLRSDRGEDGFPGGRDLAEALVNGLGVVEVAAAEAERAGVAAWRSRLPLSGLVGLMTHSAGFLEWRLEARGAPASEWTSTLEARDSDGPSRARGWGARPGAAVADSALALLGGSWFWKRLASEGSLAAGGEARRPEPGRKFFRDEALRDLYQVTDDRVEPAALEEWRRERGLQQRQMAKLLGKHRNTWSSWENPDDHRDPPGWLRFALEGLDRRLEREDTTD